MGSNRIHQDLTPGEKIYSLVGMAADSGSSKIWTVDGFTTIVPGVIDVTLTDGTFYIQRSLSAIMRDWRYQSKEGGGND